MLKIILKSDALNDDINHGNDEDDTVEECMTVDLLSVADLEAEVVNERCDKAQHGVVVGSEDDSGQDGGHHDQDPREQGHQ